MNRPGSRSGRDLRLGANRVASVLCTLSLLLLTPGLVAGQDVPPDSTSAVEAPADTAEGKPSKNRLNRMLSDYVYASPETEGPEQVKLSVNPYMKYAGRYIRNIHVAQLNVFDATMGGVDSTADQGTVMKVANALHVDTHKRNIRMYFLMKSGDALDPFAISDTERILRTTRFLEDAKIEVIPVPEAPDSVDLLVVTRDVWSLGVTASVISPTNYKFKIFDRNFLGFGDDWENEFQIDQNRRQKVDYRGEYAATNLWGTFVDGTIGVLNTHRLDGWDLRFARAALAPQIRFTGAFRVNNTINKKQEDDDSTFVPTSFDLQDTWLGIAFFVGENPLGGLSRTRLVPALRVVRYNFRRRPEVGGDLNVRFQDRVNYLTSLSLSKSDYAEGRLIRGYGQTEDVPYGYLATLTAGWQGGEFRDRVYGGLLLRAGKYNDRFGYLEGRVDAGGFYRNHCWEDGVVRFSGLRWSRLYSVRNLKIRNFFFLDYTYGHRRVDGDRIALEPPFGIPGLKNTGLKGNSRLRFAFEPVAFTPWNILGFRLTSFAFLHAGTTGKNYNSWVLGKYSTTFGFGFRIHNPRLVFDPIEFRFTFFPNVPSGSETTLFDFGTIPLLPLNDFNPGAPRLVSFD